jgi:hypothetical protein
MGLIVNICYVGWNALVGMGMFYRYDRNDT